MHGQTYTSLMVYLPVMQGRPEDSRAPIQPFMEGPLWDRYADAHNISEAFELIRGPSICQESEWVLESERSPKSEEES